MSRSKWDYLCNIIPTAADCLYFWFGYDCSLLFLILISLSLLKIVYDSGLVVIIDVFFMILIWIWLFMIVYDSASLLIFSSMTLLGIWSLITVFASPVVLFTNPALRPPQRGVGGTRALAHSICIYIYIYMYIYICTHMIYTHNVHIYIYMYIYIYSDPKVDRIFFGGCGIYVGIMLDVGQRKKHSSWNIGRPAGKVKNR